jgi:hypothetical protein
MLMKVYEPPDLRDDEAVETWSKELVAVIKARQNRYDELKKRLQELKGQIPTAELEREMATISAEMQDNFGSRRR